MINNPTVSVIMITYGHEDYITQAIDGVLMQQCDFEIELIIANDCSPDKTDDVVNGILANHKKASLITYIKREKNMGFEDNFIDALNKGRGKYLAICEGDDYWSDEFKLKKQVDFLEANNEYILCTHNYSVYNQSKDFLDTKNKFDTNVSYDLNTYFDNQFSPTLTSCWRNIFKDYGVLREGKWFSDFYLFFGLLKHGKGYFMVDNMATYRIHDFGVCSGLPEDQKIVNHIHMLEDLLPFNESIPVVKMHLARYNLIYFNYLIRVKKLVKPEWKYLKGYYKSEKVFGQFLRTTFLGLPFYFVRYWIPNLLTFKGKTPDYAG